MRALGTIPWAGIAVMCVTGWLSAASGDLAAPPEHRQVPPSPSRESEGILQTLKQQALPDLISSLTEKKSTKRLRITRIAGDAKDHEATGYLVEAYDQTNDEGVRCKILESIGKFHDHRQLEWLSGHLDDPLISIQCFTIWALGELRDPRAPYVLRRKLWSSNRFVQMTAIDALGKSGKNGAVASELGIFLRDDDVQVRYIAAKALLGTAGPEVVPELAERLTLEPSVDVQEVLAKGLGTIGGSVGVGHLIELLKSPPSQATEHWAEVGLEAADPHILFAALRPLLEGNDFRLKVSAQRILSELERIKSKP
jgi:HEAT repeat protein